MTQQKPFEIPIRASCDKGFLVVTVQNPFDPTTHVPKIRNGFWTKFSKKKALPVVCEK